VIPRKIYYRQDCCEKLYIAYIERETKSSFWIKTINGIETKVSKKKYRTGIKYFYIYYYEVTEELNKKYIEQQLKLLK